MHYISTKHETHKIVHMYAKYPKFLQVHFDDKVNIYHTLPDE